MPFPDRAIKGNHIKGLKDICGRLTDLQGQISILSYFNLLDLAVFLMHLLFPVSFFVAVALGVR